MISRVVRAARVVTGFFSWVSWPSAQAPATDAAEAVFYNAIDRGLSFKITMGNVLTLGPPLTITQGEMDQALDILEASLSALE